MHTDKKEEIKMLMFEQNISYQELADHLHIPKHRLYYNLNASSDIPLELYINIMNVLNSQLSKRSKCTDTVQYNCTTNSVLANAITEINNLVSSILSDGQLDAVETMSLRVKLEDIRVRLNHKIDEWIKAL